MLSACGGEGRDCEEYGYALNPSMFKTAQPTPYRLVLQIERHRALPAP
jgi:hypothetical protein